MLRTCLIAIATASILLSAAVLGLTAATPAAAAETPAAAPTYVVPAPDTRPLQYGRFTVEVVGKGPDVILIPGLNSSRDTFKDLVAAEKGHYRFHRIQIAGFAGTPSGDNAAGEVVAPTAEAISRYIHDRKLKKPAVIGHSLGGEAALMLAARHPDQIGRAMAVDSLPFLGSLFGQKGVTDGLKKMAEGMAGQMAGSNDQAWLAGALANTAPLLPEGPMKAEAIGWGVATDRSVSARAFRDLIVTDLRDELGKITAPVTVLYAHGPQYGAQTAEQTTAFVTGLYTNLKGANLIRVEPAHHFLMADQPARFRAEVVAFLSAK